VNSQPSVSDVLACVSLAIGVFGVSLVPFFLLINTDFERAAHTATTAVKAVSTRSALTVAALLILTIPTGDHR
jgi:hypothetical protein